MLKELLFAILATYGFGIIFEIRGKNLYYSSVAGGIGWCIHVFSLSFGFSLVLSYFFASVVLTIISEFLARFLKTPVTSILISGLIPLVPGGGVYYTMYYVLERNMEQAIFKGIETLFIAGSLSFGIVVVSSLVRIVKTGEKNRYSRNIPDSNQE
jgi:uncharacterized membrane protein YjjB (DUF3815 family)